MEDLIKVVAEKYEGNYTKEQEKVVYTPDGALRYQLSQALFVLNNYKIAVVSHEDGVTGTPYKIFVFLQNLAGKKLILYPRSYFGKLIRNNGYKRIQNKYRTNFSKQLLEKVNQDYTLESLLIKHNISILTKKENDISILSITPIESVLDIKTMSELIDIGSRLANIRDEYT